MNNVIFGGLFIAFLQAVKGQTDICQAHMVQECSDSLLSTAFNFSSLIVEKDTIDSTCDRIDDAKKCIEDYVDNCHSQRTKEDYLDPAKPLFDSCKLFREEYLPNFECYRQFQRKYDNCLKEIPEIVGSVAEVIENNSTSEIVKKFCCSVNKIIGCVVFPTQQKCGHQAAQAMDHLLTFHLPPPVVEKCRDNNCVIDDEDENTAKTPTDSKGNPVNPTKDPNNSAPIIASKISIWSTILSVLIISKFA